MGYNKCSKCERYHAAPTGKNCKFARAAKMADADEGTTIGTGEKSPINPHLLPEDREDISAPLEPTSQDETIQQLEEQNAMLRKALALQAQKPASQAAEPSLAVNETLARLTQAIESMQKPRHPVSENIVSNDTLLKLTSAVETLAERVTKIDKKVVGLAAEKVEQPPSTPKEGDNAAATPESLSIKMAQLLGTEDSSLRSPSVSYNTDDEEDKRRGKTVKSGRELRAESQVVHEVPWPHLRVYRAPDFKGIAYDSLTASEFVYGYIRQIEESKYSEIKSHLLKHLVDVMEDIKDYPEEWEIIRAFHALVLSQIERGLLFWDQDQKIAVLRQKYVFGRMQRNVLTQPCIDYNNGTCQSRKDHDGTKHICGHCYGSTGKQHLHPTIACFKLHGPPRHPPPNRHGHHGYGRTGSI